MQLVQIPHATCVSPLGLHTKRLFLHHASNITAIRHSFRFPKSASSDNEDGQNIFFVGREGPFSFLPCLIDFVDAASRSRRAPDCRLPHNTSFITVNCSFLVTANAGHKYYHAMLNTEVLDQQGDQSRHQPSQTPLLFASGKSPLMWYVNKERTIYMANH